TGSPMSDSYLRNVIEAALLAAGAPLPVAELTRLLDESARPSVQQVRAVVAALAEEYSGRGIELKETAGGFRSQVRRERAGEISRLCPERSTRYSRALLETLALIAYRQPVTRAEIEAVRGVAVNPNIIRTLIERNWVRVVGHRNVPGHPELLGTTREFLDYFGLKSLDELPPLAELKAISDVNLQLGLAEEENPEDDELSAEGGGQPRGLRCWTETPDGAPRGVAAALGAALHRGESDAASGWGPRARDLGRRAGAASAARGSLAQERIQRAGARGAQRAAAGGHPRRTPRQRGAARGQALAGRRRGGRQSLVRAHGARRERSAGAAALRAPGGAGEPRAAHPARPRHARAHARTRALPRAHSGGAPRAAPRAGGSARRLSVEGLPRDPAARRPEERNVGSGEGVRRRQALEVFGGIGLAAHGGARAPGVESVDAHVAHVLQLRGQHLRQPLDGELGHGVRAPVGAPAAPDAAGGAHERRVRG